MQYSEYEYAKKIIYFCVPIFFILTIVPLPMVSNMISVYTSIDLTDFFQHPLLKLIQLFLFLTIVSGLIKISLAIIRKKFRLYYAKGCFTLMAEKNDEIQNMTYLSKGLDSYNSYLRRNLNIQINNIKKIESKIATFSLVEKEQTIKKISNSFLGKNLDTFQNSLYPGFKKLADKETLEPARVIYDILECPPKFEFLVQQSLMARIKDQVTLAVTLIPLIISVLTFVIEKVK